jgi:hypothetical protein
LQSLQIKPGLGANFPFEQVRQLSAPLELENPAGHRTQDFESFAYVPSGQAWKPVELVELSADPGGMSTKLVPPTDVLLVPPTEMLFGGIREQFLCIADSWYHPAGQKSQEWEENTDAKRPGAHWMQDTDPLMSE